jgi:hypothetical protein
MNLIIIHVGKCHLLLELKESSLGIISRTITPNSHSPSHVAHPTPSFPYLLHSTSLRLRLPLSTRPSSFLSLRSTSTHAPIPSLSLPQPLQLSLQHGLQRIIPPCQQHHIVRINRFPARMFAEDFEVSCCVCLWSVSDRM